MHALRQRLRVAGLDSGRALALPAFAFAWSAVLLGALAGAVPLNIAQQLLLLVALPLGLAIALLFSGSEASPALRVSAAWAGLIFTAVVVAIALQANPMVAFVLPALALSALVASRRPALALVGAFLLTGAYGSISAFTVMPVGESVDVLLAGVWGAVIVTWMFGRRRHVLAVWPGIAATGLYVFLTALEVLTADSLWLGLRSFRGAAWYMAFYFVIAYAGWSRETYERMARGLVAVAALVGGYATLRLAIGPANDEEAYARGATGIYNFVEGELKLIGSFPSRHELAIWAASAMSFCVGFGLTRSGVWRLVAAAGATLCAVAVLGTDVRIAVAGAVVGFAVVVVLFQATRGVRGLHLGQTFALVGVTLLLGGTAWIAAVDDPGRAIDRYSAILQPEKDASFQARRFKWENAFADIDNAPLGNGLGTAGRLQYEEGRFLTVASRDVDNGYLKVAYEQGFAVMLLFIAATVLLLAGIARRTIVTRDPRLAGLGMGAAGALATWLVSLTTGVYVEGLPALAVWIMVGVGAAGFVTTSARQSVGSSETT